MATLNLVRGPGLNCQGRLHSGISWGDHYRVYRIIYSFDGPRSGSLHRPPRGRAVFGNRPDCAVRFRPVLRTKCKNIRQITGRYPRSLPALSTRPTYIFIIVFATITIITFYIANYNIKVIVINSPGQTRCIDLGEKLFLTFRTKNSFF